MAMILDTFVKSFWSVIYILVRVFWVFLFMVTSPLIEQRSHHARMWKFGGLLAEVTYCGAIHTPRILYVSYCNLNTPVIYPSKDLGNTPINHPSKNFRNTPTEATANLVTLQQFFVNNFCLGPRIANPPCSTPFNIILYLPTNFQVNPPDRC